MAGRDRQAACRVMPLDRELDGRRRREADVDYVATDGLQRRDYYPVEHRARHAAVPADDNCTPRGFATRRFWSGMCDNQFCPGAEGGGVSRDHFRGQGFAYAAPDSGDTDHQPSIGHRSKLGEPAHGRVVAADRNGRECDRPGVDRIHECCQDFGIELRSVTASHLGQCRVETEAPSATAA